MFFCQISCQFSCPLLRSSLVDEQLDEGEPPVLVDGHHGADPVQAGEGRAGEDSGGRRRRRRGRGRGGGGGARVAPALDAVAVAAGAAAVAVASALAAADAAAVVAVAVAVAAAPGLAASVLLLLTHSTSGNNSTSSLAVAIWRKKTKKSSFYCLSIVLLFVSGSNCTGSYVLSLSSLLSLSPSLVKFNQLPQILYAPMHFLLHTSPQNS